MPRILVSDGRAFYEGVGANTDTGDVITGSPVSPGVVEGVVHVVLNPRESQLAPGEILVCPGTDPAWTLLFMTAGGLIAEVGGDGARFGCGARIQNPGGGGGAPGNVTIENGAKDSGGWNDGKNRHHGIKSKMTGVACHF